MTTVTTAGWPTETRSDGFAGLREEWEDLYNRCATATPFQSYGWLEAWWQAYGQPGRLRLTLVRHDGRLVAAAPMLLRRRVLHPLGGALADYTDFLIDDTHLAPATEALAAALLRVRGWQAIDLPESRPGSNAGGSFWNAWPGRRHRIDSSACSGIAALPLEDHLARLTSRSRRTARHKLTQIERSGLTEHLVAAGDAGRAVDDLLRLHALYWAGRGINREHLSPAFAAHLRRAVAAMLPRGQAALVEFRDGDRLMATQLMVIGRDVLGGYLFGADPALRARVELSTLLLSAMAKHGHRCGLPMVSNLRGEEPYKQRWRPTYERNERILLVRPGSLPGAGYAARVKAERAAIAAAKEHAPWLRTVRDRIRR